MTKPTTTLDMYLAAFLVVKHEAKIIFTDVFQKRVRFFLDLNGKNLTDILTTDWDVDALCNARRYAEQIRNLKGLVIETKSRSGF